MKNKIYSAACIAVLLLGIALMGYPFFSDWWNSFHQSQAIVDYMNRINQMEENEQKKMWKEALDYNEQLLATGNLFRMTKEEKEKYERILDTNGSGIMAYLEIPKIKCRLPVYHGTEEAVLQVAVGHISGTSFPVGGKGSHCVLSGHRGLPSAKLFTNLDQLDKGDMFFIHVLTETLSYEVDDIYVVLPEETEKLQLEKEEDLCTLVTCTPYGVNTHRLLIRGKRVEQKGAEEPKEVDKVEKIEKKSGWLWAVVVLTVISCVILGKNQAKAATVEKETGGYYLVLKFEYGEVPFSLYQMDDMEKEMTDWDYEALRKLEAKIQEKGIKPVRSGTTRKDGTLSWEKLEKGRYLICGETLRIEGEEILPVPALVSIPMGDDETENVPVIHIKYEIKENILEQFLPKTGQLLWPVAVLAFLGCLLIGIGIWKRR